MGYYGPIGAGAIYYTSLVRDQFEDEGNASSAASEQIRTLVKPITYALVLSSLLGHTLTIPVLKYFLTWLGVGNIQLRGEEGDHEDHESDAASFYGEGDADRREAEYEAGETREDGQEARPEAPSIMSNAPNAQPASVKGAYHWDGRWNDHASWRQSSSHRLPSTGHKLGTHFAAEQHRNEGGPNLPKRWDDRVRDLESSAGQGQASSISTQQQQQQRSSTQRPSIDDKRRQSII
jgi:NhaP-type Na+/H+ or K+/H+ antiporter